MAGTVEGGRKAAKTTYKEHGIDFYRKMGAEGGRAARTGGFWHRKYVLGDTEFISNAGRKGGKLRRGRKYPKSTGLQGEEYLPLPNSYAGTIQIEIPDLP